MKIKSKYFHNKYSRKNRKKITGNEKLPVQSKNTSTEIKADKGRNNIHTSNLLSAHNLPLPFPEFICDSIAQAATLVKQIRQEKSRKFYSNFLNTALDNNVIILYNS